MKRIEHLIKMTRRNTENEQSGITDGISQSDFERYCDEANEIVRSKLVQSHAHKFIVNDNLDAEKGVEFYSVPVNTYLNFNLVDVEASTTNRESSLYRLRKRTSSERVSVSGSPTFWIPSGTGFYVNPIPDNASTFFRLSLVERTRNMALRAGTVASFTYDTNTRALTALTITAGENGALANQSFDENDFLCLLDANGNMKMQGIQYSSIDTGTGIVSIEGATFTALEGSTIAIGDYVVKGKYSSSHSQLDQEAQKSVLAYMEYLVLKRDSSDDSQEQYATFERHLDTLVDDFEKDNQEMIEIPIITTEYM